MASWKTSTEQLSLVRVFWSVGSSAYWWFSHFHLFPPKVVFLIPYSSFSVGNKEHTHTKKKKYEKHRKFSLKHYSAICNFSHTYSFCFFALGKCAKYCKLLNKGSKEMAVRFCLPSNTWSSNVISGANNFLSPLKSNAKKFSPRGSHRLSPIFFFGGETQTRGWATLLNPRLHFLVLGFISLPMLLQKYAHLRIEDDINAKHYTRYPIWWLGLVLMGLGELGNFTAYGFAPASLVAPLGTTAVIGACLKFSGRAAENGAFWVTML